MREAELSPHPDRLGGAIAGVRVVLWPGARGALRIRYAVRGALDRLRLPPPAARIAADRLWEHTCFELFIGRRGRAAYREINLSPSGAWAAYGFSSYREGMRPIGEAFDPRIAVRRGADALTLEAEIHARFLDGPVLLGIAAILEEEGGELSYWALRHPPGRPDFHHVLGFALELDEARA